MAYFSRASFSRIPTAWKQARPLRKGWWMVPFLWFFVSQTAIFHLSTLGQKLGAMTSTMGDAVKQDLFTQLYQTTLVLTAGLTLGALLWFVVFFRLRKEIIPVWGYRYLRWVALAFFLGGLVLFQGAWRCQVPPTPYTEAMQSGLHLFMSIQGQLLQSTVLFWGVMGILIMFSALLDAIKCVHKQPQS